VFFIFSIFFFYFFNVELSSSRSYCR